LNQRPYPLLSLSFIRAYGITMRPYLLFISAAAGMAGFASGPVRGPAVTLGAFFVFFSAYGFSQGLTDSFQMDTDAISSPYRPMIQGLITPAQVLPVSLAGLAAGCMILLILNPQTLPLGVLSVFGLATYTFFKRRWWGGPFYNAWIVALLPVIGRMAALGPGHSPSDALQDGMPAPLLAGIFFAYANFVLAGYTKDISADRQTGYRTFAVVFGWTATAVVSDFFAGLSVLATGRAVIPLIIGGSFTISKGGALFFFVAAAVVLAAGQVQLHRIRDEKLAYRPIANVVRGFLLLQLAVISSLRGAWFPAAVIFYLLFEGVLSRRPAKDQV